MHEDIYLTPAQLSERYQRAVSLRTLANWRSNGEGPSYTKIGGKVLYPLEAVLAWEKTRRILRTLAVVFFGCEAVAFI